MFIVQAAIVAIKHFNISIQCFNYVLETDICFVKKKKQI